MTLIFNRVLKVAKVRVCAQFYQAIITAVYELLC